MVQIAFSQDGKRVRVRDESGGLWEWIVGEAKARRLDLNGGTCLAISQEGERVVSSHATNRNALGAAVGGPPAANREAVRLVVWDLGIDAVRPTPLAAFARHSAPVRQVTFVAEGRIRSSDPQTGSFLWDAGTGLTVSSGGERVEPGLPTAISSDGRTYLATSNLLRPIRAIDAPGGAGEKEWPLPGRVVSLAVSPCGEQVLAGFAKSVVVVHADSAEPVDFLESPTDLGAGLVVSPDGRFAAAPSSEGPVLWRLPPTPGQAVADAERLTRADPCSAPYRVLQGLCHLRAGSPDRAKADIEEALFLDPDSAEAHFQDALLRIERGEALGPSVERAVALDPKVAEALFLSGVTRAEIGLALGKQEDLVKAKADLSRAFELKPELRDLPLVRQGQDRP